MQLVSKYKKHISSILLVLIGSQLAFAYECPLSKQLGRLLANEFSIDFPKKTLFVTIEMNNQRFSVTGIGQEVDTSIISRINRVVKIYSDTSNCFKSYNEVFTVPLIITEVINKGVTPSVEVQVSQLESIFSYNRYSDNKMLEPIVIMWDKEVIRKKSKN